MTIDGINPADPGIQLLATAVAKVPANDLRLIHCGGLPGIEPGCPRLILDVRELPLAGEQCIPDTLSQELGGTPTWTPGTATDAVIWPRAHLGKDFTARCLSLGTLALKPGGRLWCAARKAKGGKTIAAAMKALVGNVEVRKRNRGYHLYCSEVVAPDIDTARANLNASYEVTHPLLAHPFKTVPGVFSRTHLDRGTAALMAFLTTHLAGKPRPKRVLDLCAGVGPLTLWAAQTWPQTQVLAVDSNILAAALIPHNARMAGCEERVTVHLGDGIAKVPRPVARHRGRFQLALVNPPTHAPVDAFASLLTPLKSWLMPGRSAWIVVNRSGRLQRILRDSGATVEVHCVPGFELVHAIWGETADT